jgi:hypothetical protein
VVRGAARHHSQPAHEGRTGRYCFLAHTNTDLHHGYLDVEHYATPSPLEEEPVITLAEDEPAVPNVKQVVTIVEEPVFTPSRRPRRLQFDRPACNMIAKLLALLIAKLVEL